MKHWHVGILTPDIDGSMDAICAMSGTPRESWMLTEIEFGDVEMVFGDGGRLRSALGRVGGIVYELLQPTDDRSYQAKAMKSRGPGFHHNAYICEDDQDAVVNAMKASGAKVVWETRHGNEHVYYLEFPDKTVWEIINCCPFMPE
jgi:hypothetical protein